MLVSFTVTKVQALHILMNVSKAEVTCNYIAENKLQYKILVLLNILLHDHYSNSGVFAASTVRYPVFAL